MEERRICLSSPRQVSPVSSVPPPSLVPPLRNYCRVRIIHVSHAAGLPATCVSRCFACPSPYIPYLVRDDWCSSCGSNRASRRVPSGLIRLSTCRTGGFRSLNFSSSFSGSEPRDESPALQEARSALVEVFPGDVGTALANLWEAALIGGRLSKFRNVLEEQVKSCKPRSHQVGKMPQIVARMFKPWTVLTP